ncbi:MAG: hypothetical protein Ct9H90mP16_01680 [Candidatus Poseidoniales archaeon]|nr:MAG: hypothetical protein Ct9H90mP16_01680 [Candidatus Poseidoniales archaeon]
MLEGNKARDTLAATDGIRQKLDRQNGGLGDWPFSCDLGVWNHCWNRHLRVIPYDALLGGWDPEEPGEYPANGKPKRNKPSGIAQNTNGMSTNRSRP